MLGALYTLASLPIGPYRLDVSLQGFKSYSQTGIVLQVNSNPVDHRSCWDSVRWKRP